MTWKKFLSFNGRASRTEWWRISFALVLLKIAMSFSPGPANVIDYIFDILLIIPFAAVTVRRLHDLEKSGWLALIGLIPFLGILVLIYYGLQPTDICDNKYGPAAEE